MAGYHHPVAEVIKPRRPLKAIEKPGFYFLRTTFRSPLPRRHSLPVTAPRTLTPLSKGEASGENPTLGALVGRGDDLELELTRFGGRFVA